MGCNWSSKVVVEEKREERKSNQIKESTRDQLLYIRKLKNESKTKSKIETENEKEANFLFTNSNQIESKLNNNNLEKDHEYDYVYNQVESFKKDDQNDKKIPNNYSISSNNSILQDNTITINASVYDSMHPIWVFSGKEIKFEVNGRWTHTNTTDYEYKGLDSIQLFSNSNLPASSNEEYYQDKEFNEGELICRVLGGEYFSVCKNLSYLPRVSGPIFFRMYIKNPSSSLKPKGKLVIQIKNSLRTTFSYIESSIGWDESKLYQSIHLKSVLDHNNPDDKVRNTSESYKISYIKSQLLVLINKLRLNSDLFLSQYLYGLSIMSSIYKKLFRILSKIDSKSKGLFSLSLKNEVNQNVTSIIKENKGNEERKIIEYMNEYSHVKMFDFCIKGINESTECNIYSTILNISIRLLLKLIKFDDVRECLFSNYTEFVYINIENEWFYIIFYGNK